jgi:uncharacterized membrane protein
MITTVVPNFPFCAFVAQGSLQTGIAIPALTRVKMLKSYWRWSLIILLLAFFMASPASALSKSVLWNRFDVDISVNPDGTFDVVEAQEIQFAGGPFTFGFRDINTRYTEAITDIVVSDERGAYQLNSSGAPRTYTIEHRSDSYYIKWFFDETTDANRTFLVSYKVHGGLRYYDEGDQLWWKAVYDDHPGRVMASTVTVHVPAPAEIVKVEAYETNAEAQVQDAQTAQFVAQEALDSGQGLEVRVQFTHGVVAGAASAWQEEAENEEVISARRTVVNLFVILLSLMMAVLAPVATYLSWYRWGRDPRAEIVPTYLPEPPSDLPPGLVGTLVDEQANTRDVLATIVDLARRGYLRIEEVGEDDGSGYSTSDFLYTKLYKPTDDLYEYERYLLQKLFAGGKERLLSDLKESFYSYNEHIKKLMYETVTEKGLFVANPRLVRGKWIGIGVGVIALSLLFGCLGTVILSVITDTAILLAFGPGILGIGFLIIAYFMPKKTQKGADEAAKWKAFFTYLKNIGEYTDLEKAADLFERYLPYAIAFGINKAYIRQWEPVQQVSAPQWYGPQHPQQWYDMPQQHTSTSPRPPGHGSPASQGHHAPTLSETSTSMSSGLSNMSAGLSSMLSTAASTLSSRPASSGGGSSGGWSGGGFSGGGGGGGGSGGFG